MKSWKLVGLLLFGIVLPAYPDEEKGEADKKPPTSQRVEEDEDQEAEAKASPIRRLAEMRLDEYLVPARAINLPLPGRTRTVQDVRERCLKWSQDEQIGAILLDIGNVNLSLPDVEELRASLKELRDEDKKVLAFLNGGGPEGYLLACAADEIVIAPTGSVAIPGLGRAFPFLKGHLQMLGMEIEVIAAGRYKYPGFLSEREPTPHFREEFEAILDSWFGDYKGMIAAGRKLPADAVGDLVDTAMFFSEQALQRGLVDKVAYYDEYRDQVLRREKLKRAREEDFGLSRVKSIQDLFEVVNESLKKAEEARKEVGPKIAVLHARGPIIDMSLGSALSSQVICRDDFVKVVDELRKNKSIKAVVMRVDSPGGSGYASDAIWQALRRLDEAKPLVVSMGSVAGSGGYYIACPARRIFAQPTTITGSIGVIGMFQSAWSALNRMDYEMAVMQRGARSMLGSPHRGISKEDRAFIQKLIDDFYGIFVDRVAQTRRIPAEEVRKIAEGRIYTGRQAKEIGLVDELGGLADAIESVRTMANIPPSAELKIVHYPRPSSLGEFLEGLGPMMSTPGGVEAILPALSAAPPVSFRQQLRMFSRPTEVLCWMAAPGFYESGTTYERQLDELIQPCPANLWDRVLDPAR